MTDPALWLDLPRVGPGLYAIYRSDAPGERYGLVHRDGRRWRYRTLSGALSADSYPTRGAAGVAGWERWRDDPASRDR